MTAGQAPCQIVLAEDNPADVGLVREALREHAVDCDLHVLSDGQEVLAFIDQLDANLDLPCPDLLLLDLFLPKYDGRQILEYLRASERCGGTPVVMLTSSDRTAVLESARKNAAHYFQKPCSLTQFLHLGSVVKEAMRGGRRLGG